MEPATQALMDRVKAEIQALLASGEIYIDARQTILRTIADGGLHRTAALVNAYEPDPNDSSLTYEPGSKPDVTAFVRSLARRAAALEAVGLLVADGIAVSVGVYDQSGVNGGQTGGFDSLNVRVEVAWMSGNSGSRGGGSLYLPLPASPARIRIARPVRNGASPLDYASFEHDLAPLGLDTRTLRALREAFVAFRAGMYLSTAVLAGTVVEGAVRTLAPRLSPVATDNGRKDLTSGQLRTLTKRLFEVLRSVNTKELPGRADQLSSHIHRFIDLRNYGAHTGSPDAGLEKWFEDDLNRPGIRVGPILWKKDSGHGKTEQVPAGVA